MVTSTDSRESSLEKTGGGELDLVVKAVYLRSKKGLGGRSMVVHASGGDDGGASSKSMAEKISGETIEQRRQADG